MGKGGGGSGGGYMEKVMSCARNGSEFWATLYISPEVTIACPTCQLLSNEPAKSCEPW